MDHIVGLDAKGVEAAIKLVHQYEIGLVEHDDFLRELWLIRSRHTLSGYRWLETPTEAILVKVIATSYAYLRYGDADGFEESED